MTMAPTHLLVGNPTAQSGRNAQRIDKAKASLERHGVVTAFVSTQPGGATVDAVREAIDGGTYACVISMGGDGTFREVATALMLSARREDVALGMLPTGTANDQGRSFGLSADESRIDDNVGVIARGKETRLDAGHILAFDEAGQVVRDTYFFDSAGWGISARVLAVRNRDRGWVESMPILRDVYRDHLVYAGALLRTFLESYVVDDQFTAVVTAQDGRQWDLSGLTDLIIKGTRLYGGAWVLDPTSEHDDGQFEAVPFRGKADWTSKAIVDLDGNPLGEQELNKVGIEHSKPLRASRFDIALVPEGGVPLAAQIDGEEFPATPQVRVEVVARAIRLLVP